MARKAVPLAVSRASGRGKSTQSEGPVHVKAAEEMLLQLGELKGLGLKLGQMLSYIDGALPAEAEPAFRRVLSKLQRDAPSLPWSSTQQVLTETLGDWTEHFATLEEEPFAAASIGQVHRGTLHDGTAVAVKIQYPGIADAMRADLANLDGAKSFAGPLMALMGASSNAAFAGNVLAEVRARMEEELDYEREARMQQRFADMFANVPGLVVPKVFVEHSGPRVLTSAFEHGKALDDVTDAPQALRNRWAATLAKSASDSLYVHGTFNGDPHPGNYLFRDDGTVVLLDFGCVKEIPAAMAEDMRGYMRAAIRAARTDAAEDWAAFDRALAHALGLDRGDPDVATFYRELFLFMIEPALYDRDFAFTPEWVAQINDKAVEGKRALIFGRGMLPRMPKLPPMPADYTFINRLQWGFYSVLTRLQATINWHALLPETLRANGS
ncbi:MAG: AarF/ABC1/UbiB kinase family protein [Myxococcota bacterium]